MVVREKYYEPHFVTHNVIIICGNGKLRGGYGIIRMRTETINGQIYTYWVGIRISKTRFKRI